MNKRLTVYAFYDRSGFVDDYVLFCLKELKKVSEKLIFVVNGSINKAHSDCLSKLADCVIQRDNVGFDAFAYKNGIDSVDNLFDYDELVLVNNSFYGPLYPFDEIFAKMDERRDDASGKPLDFWGMTVHPRKDFRICPSQLHDYINEHLQTYFLVFKKNVFSSDAFSSFFGNLQPPASFLDAVALFELRLTEVLSEAGFVYGSFADPKSLPPVNATMIYPYELLNGSDFPLIKRKIFFEEYNNFIYEGRGDQIKKTLTYVYKKYQKDGFYDPKLIWDSLLRTQKMSVLRNNLQCNIVESSKYTTDKNINAVESASIVTLLYIYYPESINYCFGYLANVLDFSDVCIVSSRQDTLDAAKTEFSRRFAKFSQKASYKLKINKGRDVTSYLIDCKNLFAEYDYLLYFHDKLSPQLGSAAKTKDFSEHCLQSIIASKEYVANIFAHFVEDPHLGLIVPPPLNFGDFYTSEYYLHPENRRLMESLISDLNLNVPFDEFPVAPYGDFFFCRTKAMEKLFNKNWTYDDIPEEPLAVDGTILHAIERMHSFVAQSSGYYTSWACSEEAIRIHDANSYYYVKRLNQTLFDCFGFYKFDDLMNFANSIKAEREKNNNFAEVRRRYEKWMRLKSKCLRYRILNCCTLFLVGRFKHRYEHNLFQLHKMEKGELRD